MSKPAKKTPRESFDPKKVKQMKQTKAINQQEGVADRTDGRRTRLSVDGANRISRR